MPYYRNRRYEEYDNAEVNRLPSGLFFTAARVEGMEPPPRVPSTGIKQKEVIDHKEISYADFVVPKYNSTKTGKEIYLPLLEVSIEVDVVATIAWSKLTQTFTNRSKQPIKEATYCMPLYDKSTVTSFVCTIGSDKVLKGTVKPKEQAKAEFKEAVAKQQVAMLLEEHTPEVFETILGNIPAETTVKVEISYITELKADLGGDGVLVTIPTSVAPRYGTVPSTMRDNAAKSLAVPEKNGLQIKIQVSSPVAITKIESRTHPVSIEMGSHGTRVTKDIRDLSKKQVSQGFDPKKAAATLSDRKACLGKDFVLLIQANDGQLLASRAISEPHPTIEDRSALMVSINLRDLYTPNVVSPKTAGEIVFVADRSGSMEDCMEALKTAMKFFLKSLPNNCIFNICSFGSTVELMWPKSQPYNQETVDEALSYVANHFSANMRGTEIERAVRHVVERSEASVNTEIIILTDGEVWNDLSLFHFIEKTRFSLPNTRFFCLGIGEAVSHHLVAGIGRYGGGLAEVVATDSTGDWMQRVIGMLRAALTPSSWTVDVTLDGVSISAKESEDKRCIQAPHQIPDFHAFSRSSVYFILNQEFEGKAVKIKATSVYSGETFTTEIPIEKSDTGKKWVHQLAAKAVLGDLESGRSWIHDKSINTTDTKIKTETDELAKIEGEKIGMEWNISSKWTSFIVVDEKSLQEKLSRWYQAGHSDLAELTRPRFEQKYQDHAYQGAYRQSPARPAGPSCLSGGNTQGTPEKALEYQFCNKGSGIQTSFGAMAFRTSPYQRAYSPSPERPSYRSGSDAHTWDSAGNSDGVILGDSPPSRPLEASSHSQGDPPMEQRSETILRSYSTPDSGPLLGLADFYLGPLASPDEYKWNSGDGIEIETMAGTMLMSMADSSDDTNNDPQYGNRDSSQTTSQDDLLTDDSQQKSLELSQTTTQDKISNDDSTQEPASMERDHSPPRDHGTESAASHRNAPPMPNNWRPLRSRSPRMSCNYSRPPFDPSRPSDSRPSHPPARFSIGPDTNSNARSRSRPASPCEQPASSLSLTDLLSTQHTLGYFILPRRGVFAPLNTKYKMFTLLNTKYKNYAWYTIDGQLSLVMPSRREWLQKRPYVIPTAMAIVYIAEVYAAERKLWDLVVQKARAWLESEIPDREMWKGVFDTLRELLIAPGDEGADAVVDEAKDISPVEARPKEEAVAEAAKTGVGEAEGIPPTPAGPRENAVVQQEEQGKEAEAELGASVKEQSEGQGKEEAVVE
ncbi:hypothetical protein V500_02503 [Pseudogymnoascus sp. VKM F-4518 (FW-2643)]|nr:hypothetical protein V500_02503 [Pseudogymnoascus sp. VKM F-4518 (FW-2643)]